MNTPNPSAERAEKRRDAAIREHREVQRRIREAERRAARQFVETGERPGPELAALRARLDELIQEIRLCSIGALEFARVPHAEGARR